MAVVVLNSLNASADTKIDDLKKKHPELAGRSLCFLEEPKTYFIFTGSFSGEYGHAFTGVRLSTQQEYNQFLQTKCEAALSSDGELLWFNVVVQ